MLNMEQENNYFKIIDTLSSRLQITINVSSSGTFRIIFDRDPVNFELKKDAIYVYSSLGSSENCSREILLYLLEESHDGSFFASISPVSKELCLNFVCARADDYEYFEDKLSSFIRKLRALKGSLSSESSAAAPAPGSSDKASLEDLIFNAISV